ncbi:conserved hypothetical protein [Ricinus communis]|uniref:Uncharacterized protein n=1 Tax=Ricinus communis TaxID=3988 RepID=B9TDL4_RICCO|nr:conserved hypothetical protein [Ricinus communis]
MDHQIAGRGVDKHLFAGAPQRGRAQQPRRPDDPTRAEREPDVPSRENRHHRLTSPDARCVSESLAPMLPKWMLTRASPTGDDTRPPGAERALGDAMPHLRHRLRLGCRRGAVLAANRKDPHAPVVRPRGPDRDSRLRAGADTHSHARGQQRRADRREHHPAARLHRDRRAGGDDDRRLRCGRRRQGDSRRVRRGAQAQLRRGRHAAPGLVGLYRLFGLAGALDGGSQHRAQPLRSGSRRRQQGELRRAGGALRPALQAIRRGQERRDRAQGTGHHPPAGHAGSRHGPGQEGPRPELMS